MLADPSAVPAFLPHFETHQQYLRGIAYRVVRDEEAVEDVLQETRVRAWKRFPDDVDNPRAWLARVAYHVALTHLRRRRTREDLSTPLSAFDSPESLAVTYQTPDRPTGAADELQRVLRAIALLRPNYQEALRRTMAERPPAESAAAMGLTIRQFRLALFRARVALKKKLERVAYLEQRSAAHRRYRQRYPERVRALKRARYQANAEIERARKRAAYHADIEKGRAKARADCAAHREARRERARAYYAANREQIRAQQREYYVNVRAPRENRSQRHATDATPAHG